MTTGPDGLLVVDKPAGWTSHDVVGRVRRLAGTRKVGHAGTLDPMATGVLVLGLGRGTRLLAHLVGSDKSYSATVRLGVATTTDDAEGEELSSTSAAGVSDEDLAAAVRGLTGPVDQVPSAVSAIKVDGQRAYARVRAGESVDLAARPVVVSRFDVLEVRRSGEVVDVDVEVDVSSGTYVRALARDLGAALGVGGHLTALRRTRVGPFGLDGARALDALAESFSCTPLADACRAAFPAREVDEDGARLLSHGRRLPWAGEGDGPVAAFGRDGAVLALLRRSGSEAKPVLVLAPA